MVDLASKGKDFRTFALFGANAGKPVRAMLNNRHDVAKGLDIVDQRRLAPKPLLGGIGWPWHGLTTAAHDRGHQCRLFATDKSSSADANINAETKTTIQHATAKDTAAFRGANGALQPFGRDLILSAHIDKALIGTDRIAGNRHPFEDAVGIGFHQRAIHIGTGIAFIAIGHDILFVADGFTD